MEVKTDTKEKFTVIRVKAPSLSADMAADLNHQLQALLKSSKRNVVLNLAGVNSMQEEGAEMLVRTQQHFYEAGASFVFCELQPPVEDFLDKTDLLELMNTTPTESGAGDIVQMEEMERELLDEEDASPAPGGGT